jgi:hypothetical protein
VRNNAGVFVVRGKGGRFLNKLTFDTTLFELYKSFVPANKHEDLW